MRQLFVWFQAARPRTLPASLAPLIVGNWLAYLEDQLQSGLLLASLLCALALQIFVNYANDYFDALTGVDTDARVGPQRATQSGLVTHGQMRAAMVLSALAASLAGLYIVVFGSLWLLPVGIASLIAAYLYSGGPRPLASLGLGEITVFLFFGVVAVVGSYFMHTQLMSKAAWLAAVLVGLPVCAIMLVNNIRDISTDTAAGKKTLPVRIGRQNSVVLYSAALLLPLALTINQLNVVVWLSLWIATVFVAVWLISQLLKRQAQALNPLLGWTSFYSLWLAVLSCFYFTI
ncbi:1,4-dihydroxy-2-naphthoate polyprenyltransferase [Corallincola holothuriorum]|uniref:1,4-dihydroxy-2-naphthoate octaprenyltransferase n=1 Tax=Corallincola holothuriorum TaxID=2282215 RepID=A0A368N4Y8_9GAMM|nr:1,4-dihydroxy-2-naphthoate polyprenyltransferase [Corallincola holothuriorum]RCU44621.1 1,4-dihydroxy-2-naphthoate polyprenyltransferase [Corallincola holothuriorum]